MKPAVRLNLNDPNVIASMFRESERPHLIRQNSMWYDYAETHYKEIEDATIKSAVQTWMMAAETGRDRPTAHDVRQVVELLAGLPEVHKPAATYKSPSWLNGDFRNPRAILPCLNGLLDLETRKRSNHTPTFFCTYCLPLEYKPGTKVPEKWIEFLNQTFLNRKHLIEALQEAFGYVISGDRSHERIFYSRGRKRGGKGTIQTVLSHVIGEDNCVSFSLGGNESTLGDRHGLAGAENALLIQIPDASVGARVSPAATTRLKEISGGDRVPVRPLYCPTVSMVLPGCLWINANGILNFGNDADAICARLLGFPHDNYVPADKRDLTLKDKRKSPLLTVEALTGILNWALEGLDRLNERGHFEEWPESIDMKRLMLLESNSVVAFIDANCELRPDAVTDKDTLHHAFRDYCARQGLSYKIEAHFASALRNAALNLGMILTDHRPRVGKDRVHEWCGIALNDANLVEYHLHCDWLGETMTAADMRESGEQPSLETLAKDTTGRLIARPWSAPDGERLGYSKPDRGGDFEE